MPAAVYGKTDTYANASAGLNNLHISIEDLVGQYPKKQFPLLTRLDGSNFEKEVNNPKYEWKEESLRPTSDALAANITSTSATTVVATTAGVFNVDDVIQLGGEQMIVTGVNADGVTLTVIRGWAQTTAATASSGATIYRIGIAAPEGKDADGAVMQPLSDLYNYTQIFEDVVDMSGTELKSFLYKTTDGSSNSSNAITKKQQELMEMLQTALLLGRRGQDLTGKRRTLGGLKFFVDSYAAANAVNMGGASVWTTQSTLMPSAVTTMYTQAQEKIDTLIGSIMNQRGKPTALYVGYKAYRRMSMWGLDTIKTDRANTARGLTAVNTYTSQAGDLDIVLIPGEALSDAIFVVDEDRIGYKPFVDRGWFTELLAKTGDSSKWQVLGEYTFKMSTPLIGGYLYNLGL